LLTAVPALASLSRAAQRAAGAPRIWDLHVHIALVEGKNPREQMDTLIRFADRMGIERIMLFMGDPLHQTPTPDQFRFQNDQVLDALTNHHDRAFGFVYLNPMYVDESLTEFDRCVRDGPMVGVKLWVGARANRPELDPIIERAGSHKAVIFQHTWFKTTGNQPTESSPLDLVELARRHPAIPIICGHTGGNWELGLRAMRLAPNLYADLAGFDPTAGVTEMAVREIGAERVIYGSDPNFRSYASQLAKVFGANVPENAKRLILGENLRNMMLPILKAKGIRA
jgi:predicted TIM-barrel fold metal-dependent hydrolase